MDKVALGIVAQCCDAFDEDWGTLALVPWLHVGFMICVRSTVLDSEGGVNVDAVHSKT